MTLSGPTLFTPLLRQAAAVASQPPSQHGGTLRYNVMLILTDGCIMDMQVGGWGAQVWEEGEGGRSVFRAPPSGVGEGGVFHAPSTSPPLPVQFCPQETINTLVQASSLPLSILIVGIGESPELSKMEVSN